MQVGDRVTDYGQPGVEVFRMGVVARVAGGWVCVQWEDRRSWLHMDDLECDHAFPRTQLPGHQSF